MQPEKIKQTIVLLTEGTGIRASSRIAGIHRDTVLSILKFSGRRCEELLKRKLVGVTAEHIEVDEIWTFVQKKQREKINPEYDTDWRGDYYTFLGMESKTKLMFLPWVGKRTETSARNFMDELSKSLDGRVQITTDGFPAYRAAVRGAFGNRADFAQYYKEYNMLKKRKVVNSYVSVSERQHWKERFRPKENGKCYTIRSGNPDASLITTSRIERANLTLRTFNRRFGRATICFSKDEENLHYSLMLFAAHYNFVKLHGGLKEKLTPAMASGIAEKRWTVEEMLVREN